MPACGPPSSLSPLKHTRSAPAPSTPARSARRRGRRSAPEPRSSSSGSSARARDRASSCSVGRSAKPTTRKFDWCTRSSSAVSAGDRAARSRGAGAVRSADLDQAGARAGEHIGDAEPVADLDQLAARDDDLAPLGQRGERQQQRRRVVVDDERRLGAGQPAEDRRDVILARARAPVSKVVLEVRVAAADLDARRARPRERSAAEVRVDDHAGRVHHPAKRGLPGAPSSLAPSANEVFRDRSPSGARPAPGQARSGPRRPPGGRRSSRASSSTEGRSLSSHAHDTRANPATRRKRCFTVGDEAWGLFSSVWSSWPSVVRCGSARLLAVPRNGETGCSRPRDRRRRGEPCADHTSAPGVARTDPSRSERPGGPTTCAAVGWSRSTPTRPRRERSTRARGTSLAARGARSTSIRS